MVSLSGRVGESPPLHPQWVHHGSAEDHFFLENNMSAYAYTVMWWQARGLGTAAGDRLWLPGEIGPMARQDAKRKERGVMSTGWDVACKPPGGRPPSVACVSFLKGWVWCNVFPFLFPPAPFVGSSSCVPRRQVECMGFGGIEIWGLGVGGWKKGDRVKSSRCMHNCHGASGRSYYLPRALALVVIEQPELSACVGGKEFRGRDVLAG